MPTRDLHLTLFLLSAPLLASCDERARRPDEPFTFAMVSSEAVDVEVRSTAGPVAGALVHVRPIDGGPPLWQALTGTDGHARGKLVRDAASPKVAVVVQHPAFVGPWSAAEPRGTFGPFAPTSWEILEASALAAHVVEAEARR